MLGWLRFSGESRSWGRFKADVTERGKPIAKIIPIPDAETDEEQRLRRLEAQGIIRRGTGKWPPQGFWEAPRLQDPEGELRKLLIEERREGR